ncbi:MAG: radical SAM/Cys-rich domain protein [Candidatus Binatia bacterium]|nr:MAG: radical SAM/Cys-rich domain protein [Candidatus Binatia bacterium]
MDGAATSLLEEARPNRGSADSAFARTLRRHGCGPLVRGRVRTLQVNLGKLCNMACQHCHVEAGPKRTEIMPRSVAERVVELVAASPGIETVDLTGGAPELNPNFRWLVRQCRGLGREVIDRCNLTVLFEAGMEDLAEFLAAHEVHVIASLPCYSAENVEKQRGHGAFAKSIAALKILNALGYGRTNSRLRLDLVYNPVGASLPPPQKRLEAKYKEELAKLFGIEFHNLLTITNMPIQRFARWLERAGQYDAYMQLLADHFNPATLSSVMCRSLLSVGWDGRLYDCDFNQMLEIEIGAACRGGVRTVWDISSTDELEGRAIATREHCFGCTAGAGSSCGGALE